MTHKKGKLKKKNCASESDNLRLQFYIPLLNKLTFKMWNHIQKNKLEKWGNKED